MDEPEPEQTIRKAGRPRSAQSHQAILEATLALFAEVGLQGLSIEAIAERAGVGKTTIYRRWSSKEDMIKDALELFRSGYPIPDTGNIRNDLLYIAKEARELFNHNPLMGKLIIKLIAEIKTKPEIYRAFYEKLVAPRIQQFRQIIERTAGGGCHHRLHAPASRHQDHRAVWIMQTSGTQNIDACMVVEVNVGDHDWIRTCFQTVNRLAR